MQKKDPAFLFYSKDWLEGTAEMLPEEKGVYIDLLCHQHQKGSLPIDTKRLAKIVGLSEQDFLFIWSGIKSKFVENDHRYYNRKLTDVVTERLEKGVKNKIIGTLAAVVRLSKVSEEIKKEARKGFRFEDFLTEKDQNLTETITEWFQKRLKSIANANEDANANIYCIKEGGTGETENDIDVNPEAIAPKMVTVFKTAYPKYPIDREADFKSCVEIAKKIALNNGWSKSSILNGRMNDVLSNWSAMVNYSKNDKWFSTRSISDFNKEFQRLIQSINSSNDGREKSTASNSRNSRDNKPTPELKSSRGFNSL